MAAMVGRQKIITTKRPLTKTFRKLLNKNSLFTKMPRVFARKVLTKGTLKTPNT